MQYRTVFDLAQSGYRWSDLQTGFLLIAIGTATTILRLFTREKTVALRRTFTATFPPSYVRLLRPIARFYLHIGTYFFLGFALLWTSASFSVTYYRYMRLRAALQSGRALLIEGSVTAFRRSSDGRRSESFMIGNKKIQYSDGVMNGGFNTTQRQGGPIREDLPVRLWCVDGVIVRLDVGWQRSASGVN